MPGQWTGSQRNTGAAKPSTSARQRHRSRAGAGWCQAATKRDQNAAAPGNAELGTRFASYLPPPGTDRGSADAPAQPFWCLFCSLVSCQNLNSL